MLDCSPNKVVINSVKIEIKLKGEALDYVLEYTYLGWLLSFRDNWSNESKERIAMAWNKFRSLGFILANKYQKLETKNHSGILYIPGCNIRRTKKVAHKQGKEDAPDLSTESGADNTASCMKRQSDEFWRKAEYQHEGYRSSGSKSQVEMGKPCGKNGPAQGANATSVWDIRLAKERGDRRLDWQTRSTE